MLISLISLGILGLFVGAILAYASIKFHVEVNPLIEQLEAILPGANCGACGYAGCTSYAEELVKNPEIAINLCIPGGQKIAEQIAQATGREVGEDQVKKVAFVFCKGGQSANDKFEYSGKQNCQAAMLVSSGQKSCQYGCLGFGDCVAVCQFDAIHLNENNVPVIDVKKCINCGACIQACPKNIIKEIPLKKTRQVICSSHDTGKIARQVCKVACIGCGICVKNCPFEAITLEDNLAVIDMEKCTNCGICEEKCPTKAIA